MTSADGEVPCGEVQSGEAPGGDVPGGEVPGGEVPDGDGPDGDGPDGEVPAGWALAHQLAADAIALLIARGQTVAVAESLTGGMLAAALTGVAGASAAFRGGVVAYATDLKASVLGVPADLLDRRGAVDPEVAVAMADGARHRLAATLGVATTGVAGPDPADGQPVGTVYIAVCGQRQTARRALALAGSRHEIRMATVEHALGLLIATLREEIS